MKFVIGPDQEYFSAVLGIRISSVADPGCLSRISDPDPNIICHPGSRILDPDPTLKREVQNKPIFFLPDQKIITALGWIRIHNLIRLRLFSEVRS
jgi:hypothetical protein